MTDDIPKKVLLIDIENVGRIFPTLGPNFLEDFDHILICFARLKLTVPAGFASYFEEIEKSGKLQLISLRNRGKNAADFGMTYWAGKLVATLPKGSKFTVLSRDRDFKHLVYLLEHDGMEVAWSPQNHDCLSRPEDAAELSQNFYHERLYKKLARPRRVATLTSSIERFLVEKHRESTCSSLIVGELKACGLIQVDADAKIHYRDC